MATGPRGRAWAQWFCLLGGAALLLRGALGVALDPTFESPGEGWHQSFHLTSGALLLAASRRVRASVALALGFALTYSVVTFVGIADGADVAGVIPIETSDNVLHASLAAIALAAVLGTLPRRALGTPAR